MSNSKLGQIFTPEDIADFMVSLIDRDRNISVLDPCFGKGVFLEALIKAGYKNIYGVEIDHSFFKNNLVLDKLKEVYCCDFLSFFGKNKFDAIIMNPPYIRHEKFKDLKSFGVDLSKTRQLSKFKDIPARSNLYVYFIVKSLELLNKDGVLVAIIPSAWAAKDGYLLTKVISNSSTYKIISLQGLPFGNKVLTSASVLYLKKGKGSIPLPSNGLDRNTKLVKLKDIAFAKRGTTTGWNNFFINPNDASLPVSKCLSNPKKISGYSTKSNSFDYVLSIKSLDTEAVARYVKTFEKKLKSDKRPVTIYNDYLEGKEWYRLKAPIFSQKSIVFSYIVRNNLRFIALNERSYVKDNFYVIETSNQNLFLALLNNYFIYYQLEKSGKDYGGGMLKIQKYDIDQLYLPDVNQLSNNLVKILESKGRDLMNTTSDFEAESIVSKISSLLEPFYNIGISEIKKKYLFEKNKRINNGKN